MLRFRERDETDSSYYKKTRLLSIRAALDRHLKTPKSFKNMSLFYFTFSNNHQCNCTKTISRLRLREYRRTVTETSSEASTNCYLVKLF